MICFPEFKTTRTLVSQCNESYEVKSDGCKVSGYLPRLSPLLKPPPDFAPKGQARHFFFEWSKRLP